MTDLREPIGYLHILHYEGDVSSAIFVTDADAKDIHGVPGQHYSDTFTVSIQPIYLSEGASETDLIVAWLRGQAGKWHGADPHTGNCLASMIERSHHLIEPELSV